MVAQPLAAVDKPLLLEFRLLSPFRKLFLTERNSRPPSVFTLWLAFEAAPRLYAQSTDYSYVLFHQSSGPLCHPQRCSSIQLCVYRVYIRKELFWGTPGTRFRKSLFLRQTEKETWSNGGVGRCWKWFYPWKYLRV